VRGRGGWSGAGVGLGSAVAPCCAGGGGGCVGSEGRVREGPGGRGVRTKHIHCALLRTAHHTPRTPGAPAVVHTAREREGHTSDTHRHDRRRRCSALDERGRGGGVDVSIGRAVALRPRIAARHGHLHPAGRGDRSLRQAASSTPPKRRRSWRCPSPAPWPKKQRRRKRAGARRARAPTYPLIPPPPRPLTLRGPHARARRRLGGLHPGPSRRRRRRSPTR